MSETDSTWRRHADKILSRLFADGRTPTDREIRDAYPFGERAMWPYKVWLEEVRWFKAGCPDRPIRRPAAVALPGQEALPIPP